MSNPSPRPALSCPQCGGPLPKQAAWRMVACPYCRAIVTRGDRVVQREPFRQAWLRSRESTASGPAIEVNHRRWRLLQPAGRLPLGELWLAASAAPPAEQALVRLAPSGSASLRAEHDALRALQALETPGSAYFTRRLPLPLAEGPAQWNGQPAQALVLARPIGHWGSLAQVLAHHPLGLRDARHAVWLWRRVLELLGWLHAQGWTHGDLHPAHWWIHPADHGVLMLGWQAARPGGDPARDLMQAAWAIRQTLAPMGEANPTLRDDVPRALGDLLRQASESARFCRAQGAAGIDALLRRAALDAFGPPHFVPFDPLRS